MDKMKLYEFVVDNKTTSKYIKERIENMAIHADLTHFNSIEEIIEYVINSTQRRFKQTLEDSMKFYKLTRSFEYDWSIK